MRTSFGRGRGNVFRYQLFGRRRAAVEGALARFAPGSLGKRHAFAIGKWGCLPVAGAQLLFQILYLLLKPLNLLSQTLVFFLKPLLFSLQFPNPVLRNLAFVTHPVHSNRRGTNCPAKTYV